jgi:hyaluronoglucosaminidase
MTWAIRGLIEGFYGAPWSWEARLDVMAWCHERGMTHYLYAPKDDPRHREQWREPYVADELAAFERLVASETLEVGFGISPGLTMDYDDPSDRASLATKVDALLDVGVRLVCLALDDIPPRPGLGEEHARLTTWLREHLDQRAELVLVPTEYTGTTATPYLDALAGGVPTDVPIAWTGATVVCDAIGTEQAEARAAALGGRPPLIWDNYPVNDALMADRLFLGPLRGRAPGLAQVCSGYVANPMVQPRASKLPLASIAAYLRGDDPQRIWETQADALGLRAFAEACDGERPRELVAALVHEDASTDALDAWLDALEGSNLDALGGEAAPWHEQASKEAQLCRTALKLLRALERDDVERATAHGLGLGYLWPRVRRADETVFGARCSFRPVISQWPDGSWRYDGASLTEDENATDALIRFALARLADRSND